MLTTSRKWSAGAIVLAALLVIASWFLLISPQRSEASELREQTTAQQSANDQIRLKTQQLAAQYASLPARQAQLAEIKQQLPDGPSLPTLIRDLSTYAADAGVTLETVSPGAPTEFGVAKAGGVTAPGSVPVSPTPGVRLQSIPTAVTATGTYPQLTLYLQKLQSSMRRAFLVQTIQLEPAVGEGSKPASNSLQMTVQGDIFVMSTNDAPAAPVVTPSTPAAN